LEMCYALDFYVKYDIILLSSNANNFGGDVMTWRVASFIVLALWGSYLIFGSKATDVHGERVSMFFEGLAMMAVGIFAVIGYTDDFAKMTFRSAYFALVMGLMSAIGLYIQLYAMRVGGASQLPVIAMITGSWPAITVVLSCLILGSKLQPQQWLGVVAVAGGLALVNWTK
jgi:uncharacterized membrane protein